MDYLWTPWRYRYITNASKDDRCIFCDALAMKDDVSSLILHRGSKNFIVLNRFPYTTGHVKIVLAANYQPEGYNLGMNLGRCAGAGVIGHIHLHVLPRWTGDTNFMTAVGETRIEPEDLAITYDKLRRALTASG